jgi:uncharacterized membrane protein
VSSIADRIRKNERRELLLRAQLRRRLPPLAPEYGEMLLGTLVGYGIVTLVLRRFTGFDPVWALGGVALVYSLRAAYYEFKLATDPDFTVPKCGCPGAAIDRTEVVLRSRHSTLLGVPNAVLGSLLYTALLVALQLGQHSAATALAAAAVLGSTYLGHAMVMRIGALCPTCVTIAGLNLLMLCQLLT